MRNWLNNEIVITNLLIYYNISKDTTPLTMDHYEFIIYNSSLTTVVFKADIRKVANLLTPILMYTYFVLHVASAATLGPCPRPWRGVVTDLPNTAT